MAGSSLSRDSTITNNNPGQDNQYGTIIKNQKAIMSDIVSLRKGMDQMYSAFVEIKSLLTKLGASSSLSSSDTSSSTTAFEFIPIVNEQDLIKCEEKIVDREYRIDCKKKFQSLIGVGKPAYMSRSIALQLLDLMFTNKFWSCTAWTGGRKQKSSKDDNDTQSTLKFCFSQHITIISFINETIESICGNPMSLAELADVIKVRTRNCNYVRVSNRIPTSRKRRMADDKDGDIDAGDKDDVDGSNSKE